MSVSNTFVLVSGLTQPSDIIREFDVTFVDADTATTAIVHGMLFTPTLLSWNYLVGQTPTVADGVGAPVFTATFAGTIGAGATVTFNKIKTGASAVGSGCQVRFTIGRYPQPL